MSDADLADLPSHELRDGRPEALNQLVDARGASVLAYCIEVSGEERGVGVAAEVLARFRAAFSAAGAPGPADADALLLAATRHGAAALCDVEWLRRHARSAIPYSTCQNVPTLLAARALARLGSADLERLARHIERCEGCRLTEAAFSRAERAYRDPQIELTAQERTVMLAALQADYVAPHSQPARQPPHVTEARPAATMDTVEVAVEDLDAADSPPEPEDAAMGAREPEAADLASAAAPGPLDAPSAPVSPPSVPLPGPSVSLPGPSVSQEPEPPRKPEPMPIMPRRARGDAAVDPPAAGGESRRHVGARRMVVAVAVLVIGGAAALAAGAFDRSTGGSQSVEPPSLATTPPRPLTTKLPVRVPVSTIPGTTTPEAVTGSTGTPVATTPAATP